MNRASVAADPRVTVVIPNWNGAQLLRACLDSLRAQTYDDFQVIVVDNASSDESLTMLRREYPNVRVLALRVNRGFAGGCNAGIRACASEIVVTLNNDTEVESGWLAALVSALARHPDAGSATSRIMLYNRRDTLNAAGDLYHTDGTPDSRGVWQPYGPPYDREAYVFSGSGGATAYRRQMLDEIGLFCENFFMYCEDVDLGWRAQLAGWACIYAPDAAVYHHLGASGGGVLSSYYVARNTIWVLARNYPSALFARHWRAVLSAQLRIARRALRNLRGAAARARLRGMLLGLMTWPRWLGERRRIQASRSVDVDRLETLLDPAPGA